MSSRDGRTSRRSTWIADTLSPPITPAKARQALETLFELGMLAVRDDGSVEQTEGAVVTPPEVQGLAAHQYHQGMVDLAKTAIDRFLPATATSWASPWRFPPSWCRA